MHDFVFLARRVHRSRANYIPADGLEFALYSVDVKPCRGNRAEVVEMEACVLRITPRADDERRRQFVLFHPEK